MSSANIACDRTNAFITSCEACACYLEREGKTFDIVLYLHPASPLREPIDIEKCLELLVEGSYDCTASFTEALENPNETWTLHDNNEATLYKDNHHFFIPKQEHPYTYGRLNGAVYAFHAHYAKECIHSFFRRVCWGIHHGSHTFACFQN